MDIRRLAIADGPAYIALRREMLGDAPWAFASSPVDDASLDPEILARRLREPANAIVGAFDQPGRLIGAAGVYRDHHVKMAHRARVWGVYVSPAARGRGTGEALIRGMIEVARSWPGVSSLGLSVSERADGARRLYERIGFRAWGVEPGALIWEGRAYDEVHMVLDLPA